MASSLTTVASYQEIAASIASRLLGDRSNIDPLRPWNEEVIIASSGVAQSISAALIAKSARGFAALQLHTIDTFARRILNAAGEFPRIAAEEERRLAMRTASRSVDDALTATRGAAAMLERSYRDIRDSGITLGEFSQRVTRARSLRNRERIRIAIRVWQTYEKLIAKLGAADPADVLARAADLIIAGAAVPPQIAAGFYDATGAQLAILRALRSVEKLAAVYVPCDVPFARSFIGAFGPEASVLGPRASVASALFRVRQSSTREEEARATCRAIAELLASGAKQESIGVVARSLDPYDVALFTRFAAENAFAISEAVPTTLSSHRFGRAIILLLRLHDRNFLRSEVLEIVRSGLKLATRVNADKLDYETRRATIAGGRSTVLKRRTFRSPIINDYVTVVEELESLTEHIDFSWLARVIERFKLETDEDVSAVESLQRIATMFERAQAWGSPFETSSLIDAIESADLPRPEARVPRPGVWLGDVMRLRGRRFEHLFAIRMQDDVVPQRRIEDPLLPDAERRRLGMREIGDGRAEEHLLFTLLCAAAENVTFSFAASDGFGKPLRKSHYLRGQDVISATADRVATRTANRRALQLLARAGTESVFDGYVRSDIVRSRAVAALQSMSPTHLEDFGECPQKFLWKQLLGVRDLDDPEMQMQIDHREKGNIDHKILERFYSTIGATTLHEAMAALPVLPQNLIEALDRIIDDEFENLEDNIPPYNAPVRRIEQEATRRVLRQFVALDLADLAAQSLMPKRFEYQFDPFSIDVDGTSLRVEGKIDRIDEGADHIRIIDYKSGKALRHVKLADKISRGVRLQLALYALAMRPRASGLGPRISGAIKPIAGAAKLTDYSFELAETETRLRETLALFVSAIQRGDFPAFPNEDNDYNACKYCPVNHSCRTRHDAEEKRRVLRVSEPRAWFEDQSA